MATTARHSDTAPPQSQSRTAQLPNYQRPQFPMSVPAQRMIDTIYAKHDFRKLQDAYASAIAILSESVADINDRVVERRDLYERRNAGGRKGRSQQSEHEDAEPEEEDTASQRLRELTEKVASMTKRLDENLRRTIDGQEAMTRSQQILIGAANDARAHATTQATLPRPTQQLERPPRGADPDDEDEEYPEIEPTANEEPTQTIRGPYDYYTEKTEDGNLLYQSRALVDRYTGQKAYRQFRKMQHGAQFPNGEVPEPQPQDWFDETGRARPGVTQRQEIDDEDADLQIAKATTSTKCPITLQEFQKPLSSKLCQHTFESSAIREMIQFSTTRTDQQQDGRGRLFGGKPAVRCPVQSCDKLLSLDDLEEDPATERKIKRLQRAAELEREEALNHSRVEDGPELIDDDEEEDAMDVDEIEAEDIPNPARVKQEKKSSARR